MRDLLNDLEADKLLSDPDPVRRAQNQMRADLPKRFYKEVTVAKIDLEDHDEFEVHLDGRAVRTPGRALLRLPTKAVAELVAEEFRAQEEVINPLAMPVTRLVNTAVDGVLRDQDVVAEDLLRYGASDLLYYRAEGPDGLVARQNEAWNPVLDWAAADIRARFAIAEGVIFVEQPDDAKKALRAHLTAVADEPFRLTALHLMTSLTGSALLALAVDAGRLSPEQAWSAAHVDEDWQIEHWGQDAEAIARRNARHRDFLAATRVIEALD